MSIHTRFSYKISTGSVSLNLMQMSSKIFNPFKHCQSDQIQRSSRKIFTAHYACRSADLKLTLVSGMDLRIHFSNNQFINRILGVRLTYLDCKLQPKNSFHQIVSQNNCLDCQLALQGGLKHFYEELFESFISHVT